MQFVTNIFGFFLKEKVYELPKPLTVGYFLSGLFALGLVMPQLGFLLYGALAFLSWALLTRNISRSGLFFFWLPYFSVVGFGVWHSVFPYGLGIVLALLLTFLVSNLFFLLLNQQGTERFFSLPLALYLFEYAFHRLPYLSHMELPLLLGLVTPHLPVIRLVALLGSPLTLGALSLTILCLLALILKRGSMKVSLAILALLFSAFVTSNLLVSNSFSEEPSGVLIAAVQGSTAYGTHGLAGQDYLDYVFGLYTSLIADVDADIFLFPEVPMAIYYPAQEEYDGQQFVALAQAKSALLVPLVSKYRRGDVGEAERYITSLVVAPEGIIGQTSKRNLVPFSELGTIKPGTSYDPIETPYGLLGIAICYDFNAPHVLSRLKQNGAEVILAPFNDAGFGRAFHNMHSHYTIIRALEYNVPIIVANEDGISQLVDRDGTVLKRLGIGEKGVISARVNFEDKPSYYLGFGRFMEFTVFIVLLVWLRRTYGGC